MSREKRESFRKVSEEKLGETRINNQGEVMFIVEYANARDITVQFKSTGELVKTDYSNFIKGQVKSRFTPSVFGVGIIGNEKSRDENGEIIKSYLVWKNMLARCYSEKYHEKRPTYKDCEVSEEWLNYSNFKKWFNNNYYEVDGENMQLDKDILVKGNKIYSTDTCVFVPQNINKLFIKSNKARGELPIGVGFHKVTNKYQANCKTFHNGKSMKKNLGYYNTPEEAFNIYKQFKEKCIKQVADEYKDRIPQKLYDAMYKWEVEITD